MGSRQNEVQVVSSRSARERLVQALLEVGFPSDDQLDGMVGLDACDPLADGRRLVALREPLGPSAEDIATLATSEGADCPDGMEALIEALFPAGAGRILRS